MICPECGDELDDFSLCQCSVDAKPKAAKKRVYSRWGMREMVKHKLERQASERLAKR